MVTPPVVVVPPVVEPPVVTPPVVEPPVEPPVVVKPVPTVAWGRYEKVAGLTPDPAVLEKLSKGVDKAQTVGSYAIRRVAESGMVMPTEGTASFKMTASDVVMSKLGTDEWRVATAQDGKLALDFAAGRFKTSMLISSADGQMQMTGVGDITSKGALVSDVTGAPSLIRGFVSGAKATEADYIFKTLNNLKLEAQGATSWTR